MLPALGAVTPFGVIRDPPHIFNSYWNIVDYSVMLVSAVRQSKSVLYIYMCVCVCVYIYIYIYVYIHSLLDSFPI